MKVTTGAWSQSQTFHLDSDPRYGKMTDADGAEQLRMAQEVGGWLKNVWDNVVKMRDATKQAKAIADKAGMIDVRSDDLYFQQPHAILETFLLYQTTVGIKGLSARTLRALYNARGVMDAAFRRGFAHLAPLSLSFDCWLYHPQLAELADLARAYPDTPIVLNHLGGPLGTKAFGDRVAKVVAELAK